MKLAVIIVNYNVKYFLKQCLESVFNSTVLNELEIYVVDNDSKDGSVEMVEESFPEVITIANKVNVGFSTANNQAIKQTKADYVVLLNPDTLVKSDTFEKVIQFMGQTPDCGGLGVKMIDGNGKFLPESKRGLPTPDVAFYKIFGLSRLFPKSKKYGRYHLGYLDNDETHKIDVLSGAFMMMRKETLDKVGLLDEDFFMYGEDIDLSYRITKGGYNNYYFPETTIIHYKGESTKKSSVNYVYVFYKAMAIFAKKHFETSKASLFSKLIKIAIFFSASLALVKRFFEIFFLPIIDFCTVFFGLHVVKRLFQSDTGLFDLPPLINISFAVFSLLILVALHFSGGYERPIKLQKVVKGVIVGAILNSLVYVFVSEYYYFTIPKALLGITIIMFGLTFVRWILHFFKIKKYKINFFRKKIVIIGEKQESEKVKVLVEHTQLYSSIIGVISPTSTQDEEFLGEIDNLEFLQNKHRINEAIFCSENVDYDMVIDTLVKFQESDIQFKLAHTQDMFVLGSTDLNTSGELHTIKVKGIESAENKKIKRLLDVIVALKCLVFSPFLFWFQKEKSTYFSNVIAVLFGKKSMVGYSGTNKENLPTIKDGILSLKSSLNLDLEKINDNKLNRVYAKDYSVYTDIKIIRKGLSLIGTVN
ncbi:glycosyltransferase family 2 protein [Flavobacteriales bacterium]|nr:glycosyltransferase family 2 protein [Flavobacteriales bacterium]